MKRKRQTDDLHERPHKKHALEQAVLNPDTPIQPKLPQIPGRLWRRDIHNDRKRKFREARSLDEPRAKRLKISADAQVPCATVPGPSERENSQEQTKQPPNRFSLADFVRSNSHAVANHTLQFTVNDGISKWLSQPRVPILPWPKDESKAIVVYKDADETLNKSMERFNAEKEIQKELFKMRGRNARQSRSQQPPKDSPSEEEEEKIVLESLQSPSTNTYFNMSSIVLPQMETGKDVMDVDEALPTKVSLL